MAEADYYDTAEDDNDLYFNEDQIEALLDADEISSEEAGFLHGYKDA